MTEPATNFSWTSTNEEETDRFGRVLADLLEPGTVVALVGDLGAGKTRLVRAMATGLGIDPDDVQSPTFVLIREYEDGRIPVHHFDTYRLEDVNEFLDLGADELFGGDGICLVEWGDRVRDVLPAETLWIEITAVGECERDFLVRGCGTVPAAVCASLRTSLDGHR